MYDQIYSQNIGLCGFRCRVTLDNGKPCTKVVRSYRGIVMHCKRVHGLEAQMELPGMEKKNGKEAKCSEVVEPIRAAERAVLIANGDSLPFAGHSED